MKKISLFLLSLLFLVSSCAVKEEFAANKNKDSTSVSAVTQSTNTLCSNSTLIKPPVDFLFLFDNSTSTTYMNSATKAALWNTVSLISERFDYHILMAPLLASSPTSMNQASLVVAATTGLSSTVISNYVSSYNQAIANVQAFSSYSGSFENGLTRVNNLLSNNISNGIFRKNAYTIVVLISNGDDVSYLKPGEDSYKTGQDKLIATKKAELLSLRDNSLKALMLRFMSLVPHSVCSLAGNSEANYVYKEMSRQIYATHTSAMAENADDLRATLYKDSYDMCGSQYTALFNGVNNAITEVVLKHKYDYWPVVAASSGAIDESQITVTKNTGVVISESATDGFEYVGYKTAQNTRYEPTAGEPYTGHLIKLNGSARVTYPECLTVTTKAPVEYYAYVQMSAKPLEGSIVLKINGATIPQSSSNGWTYVGYIASQNVKVKSDGTENTSSPLYKSGYFLKLSGSAIYSNGASVDVVYDPAGN